MQVGGRNERRVDLCTNFLEVHEYLVKAKSQVTQAWGAVPRSRCHKPEIEVEALGVITILRGLTRYIYMYIRPSRRTRRAARTRAVTSRKLKLTPWAV